MKLLLDANLSWRMIPILQQYFTECAHVDHVILPIPAKDIEIWNYAKQNNFIIITNDEDFVDFANVKGFPPKVIVLRAGIRSRLLFPIYLYNAKLIFNY